MHLLKLRYMVAQLTPHQMLVEPAYQSYLNQLYIITYAYYLGIK